MVSKAPRITAMIMGGLAIPAILAGGINAIDKMSSEDDVVAGDQQPTPTPSTGLSEDSTSGTGTDGGTDATTEPSDDATDDADTTTNDDVDGTASPSDAAHNDPDRGSDPTSEDTPSSSADPSETSDRPTEDVVHIIEPGDTLTDISATYGVSLERIVAENLIADPNVIYAGAALVIPYS